MQREAGAPAGNLILQWRKLRSARPELFRDVVIMQQPAAVTDAVITCWSIEDLSRRYPCSLWQKDLSGGGGAGQQCRKAMQLGQQIGAWVAGKMTACLQLTDTDFTG